MVLLGDENGRFGRRVRKTQFPVQVELAGKRLEGVGNPLPGKVEASEVPLDAHQKNIGLAVAMFVGVKDVAVMPVNKVGNASHQPLAIGARDQQDRVRR